jgi:hypothetical protein
MKSKLGLTFAGAFILMAAYLIFTQGLFGESFIALILGLPWVLLLAYFEFGGVESKAVMMLLTLTPIAINVLLLYGIGALIGRLFSRGDATM